MLHLFAQYFIPKTAKRRAEIDECFIKNINNPLVERFTIFFEKESDMQALPERRNVIKKLLPERMTYGFWLRQTNQLAPGTLSILVNSDIYLNDTIQYLLVNRAFIQEHKKFIALTRYNPDGDGFRLNENPHWTQDVWALVRPNEPIPSELIQEASFELGHPGCDNKIAYVMHSYGYRITNPCDFVKTIHLQADMRRAYDSRRNKLLGIHAFVHPSLSVEDDSKLDFDLLIRNAEPIPQIRVNNWINQTKDYQLAVDPQQITQLQLENPEKKIYEPPTEITDSVSQYDFISYGVYDSIDRRGFITKNYLLVKAFSDQFAIYEDHSYYYFYDAYWPTVRRYSQAQFTHDLQSEADLFKLFCIGFAPTVLEIETLRFAPERRYEGDTLFWQRPCKTEEDAYERHRLLASPQIEADRVNIYLPFPWASVIDQYKFHPTLKEKAIPWGILGLYALRIRSLKEYLASHGKELKVHTVCQQIYWRDILQRFLQVGITDLWISHKTTQLDYADGIRLHAWPLFAVNVADPSRQAGLEDIPILQRPYLASFIGAHMGHYLSDIRLKIANVFGSIADCRIKLNDMWHFNDLVYNQQLKLEVEDFSSADDLGVVEYNQTLSESQFSLCPIGAGYNTLRLWESLAMGSIPVILSDGYELPAITDDTGQPVDWSSAVLHLPEKDIDRLEQILRGLPDVKKESMAKAARTIYGYATHQTCFGKMDQAILIQNNTVGSPQKLKIYIPYYGENDRYFWRRSKHGFHDLVMEWHQRGWCDIEEHPGPYYWLNRIGSILFFDRDQVADLIDKKRVNPRWEGEVPYQYAFFTNEYNLENDRNLKFEYWSYHPVELEKIAMERGVVPYEERSIHSIFLASIENETQEYFRNKFLGWEEVIDEFYIADKLNTKEQPKYSFAEYLEKIAHAKFGVCMRGNGPKCYREIEYAAFGTPLIITEGVDTDYPVPLVEGVHYFFAKTKEDITRYVRETDQKTWNRMSQAVRTWYEENFTTEKMFEHLKEKISQLDLKLKKPKTVLIESADHPDYQLTEKSCKIFNPTVKIVKTRDENISGITLKAGDVVINELPYSNTEPCYVYSIDKHRIKELKHTILSSNLQKNKDLAILLRWRLKNFRVKLSRNGKETEQEKYITDQGILDIDDSDIEYDISINYDYQRRLSQKYIEKNIRGKGRISFPKILIQHASLHFNFEDGVKEVDITKNYAEYMSVNDSLIPENEIWRRLKLWEFETKQFQKLEVSYLDETIQQSFTHSDIRFHPLNN